MLVKIVRRAAVYVHLNVLHLSLSNILSFAVINRNISRIFSGEVALLISARSRVSVVRLTSTSYIWQ